MLLYLSVPQFPQLPNGVIGKYHVHRVTGRLHEVLSVKLLGQRLTLGKHYDSVCHC